MKCGEWTNRECGSFNGTDVVLLFFFGGGGIFEERMCLQSVPSSHNNFN